MHEVYKRNV